MTSEGGMKSFMSESEVDEFRKKRQEEWEKVRKPDDPLERPEDVVDTRSLYEKLQEQKDKKQEEWEETHKLKNMIRGLESEETEFLDLVAKQQHQLNKQRFDEENKEIKDFRSAVSELQSSSSITEKTRTGKKATLPPAKKSQMDLIGGAIRRRKSSSSTSDTTPEKKPKLEKEENKSDDQPNQSSPSSLSPEEKNPGSQTLCPDEEKQTNNKLKKVLVPRCRVNRMGDYKRQAITIPGLGLYSDSSDSESSSSDSEIATGTSCVRYTGSSHYY